MKKRIQITAAVFLILIAVLAAAFCINRFDLIPKANEVQSTTQTEAQTTTEKETTTAAPTTKKPTTTKKKTTTTEKQTEAETVIDINNLTIIDLFPLSLAGGSWDVKHCQGIAIDTDKGYVYYSYTTILVKCDLEGNIVGTVTGFTGHLGDIAFNKKDRKLYCGYYAEGRKGFYTVIFNADKITKKNMKATDKNIVRTVHLQEVWKDYYTDLNDDGKISGGVSSPDHRFGCSGIDGIEFGPSFSDPSKKNLLTVAYGIYGNTKRKDNNYQVLLQYDVTDWWKTYAKPFSKTEFHKSGPEKCSGKYFVYTGNTSYGVQTISYFDEMNIWLLNCYKGSKSSYQNFSLFAVDADVKPEIQLLKGQPTPTLGYVLSLYQDGEYDKKHDIYGWNTSYGQKGMTYVGDGLFYIVHPYKSWFGTQTAICYLHIWDPENGSPFSLAAGVGADFSISKKKRRETTTKKKTVEELIPEGKEYLNELFSLF